LDIGDIIARWTLQFRGLVGHAPRERIAGGRFPLEAAFLPFLAEPEERIVAVYFKI
jgi:hypothetical protein